jgi:signal transduction histidine kinase
MIKNGQGRNGMADQDKRKNNLVDLHEEDDQARHRVEYLKTELLASVSHELRSPLTAIKGYAATLLRYEQRISCEERHEFLLAIKEASDRLADVIDSLLEMSELGTGRITIEKAPVNLTHLVREAVIVAEQRQEVTGDVTFSETTSSMHKHHTFDVRFEDDNGKPTQEELIIQADQGRLREVLDLLLANVVSHPLAGASIQVLIHAGLMQDTDADQDTSTSPPGNITTHTTPQPQRMVVISVQDSGKSTVKKDLSHILDPSNHIGTEPTHEVNGSGLGLAICRHIVELHGGKLWIEDVAEKGRALFISLPTS